MGTLSTILLAAQHRAREQNLPYKGLLFPEEAYDILRSAPGARLVDVRSRAEIDWVGFVPGAVRIEWLTYPGMKPNPQFLAELEQQVDGEALIMFLCRSGSRSHHAAIAATQAGYADCYNVLQGFEGDLDAHKRRNTVGGWRQAGLPWEQT